MDTVIYKSSNDTELRRAVIEPLYEEILRETRFAYHGEMAYRRDMMTRAVELTHPSIHMTQVEQDRPGEIMPSWGVACLWPQPNVGLADAGRGQGAAVPPVGPDRSTVGETEAEGLGPVAMDSAPGGAGDGGGGDRGDLAGPASRALAGLQGRLIEHLIQHGPEDLELKISSPGALSITWRAQEKRERDAELLAATDPLLVTVVRPRRNGESLRGHQLTHVWLDEAVQWKTGPRIEDYMDEVVREVMGDAEGPDETP